MIVAVIPARGGSKRIPKKISRNFSENLLFHIQLKQLLIVSYLIK